MDKPIPSPDTDNDQAEAAGLRRAVEEALGDERAVPHSEMREWLLRIAAGEFDAEPPAARLLDTEDRDVQRDEGPMRAIPEYDEAAAEAEALARAVAEARADPREVPHSEIKTWLLEVAAGNFDAPRPVPRILDR